MVSTQDGDLADTTHAKHHVGNEHDQVNAHSSGPEAALPPLSSSYGDEDALSGSQLDKKECILSACQDRDLPSLQALCASKGGLLDDRLRRTAWPILLASETKASSTLDSSSSSSSSSSSRVWQNLPSHRDEDQVQLDVNRAFVYYPSVESDARIKQRRQELSNVITNVLRRHPSLCYFQGYHDIVQVILLVLGANPAVAAVERLSLLRIRDFMLPTMSGALSHLTLLPSILLAADASLYEHLSQTAPFYFALPATLTLYAHEIQEYGDIARLFDFLLANEAVMSVYLFAVIIQSRKSELLELGADEHDMLHAILCKLPKPLDLDGLIERTSILFNTHPPERLKGWAWYNISASSVLKTTRNFQQVVHQSLSDGERFFHQQATEIERRDVRQRQIQVARRFAIRYRRPAAMTGTAILVAALALSLRRPGSHMLLYDWVSKTLMGLQRAVPGQ